MFSSSCNVASYSTERAHFGRTESFRMHDLIHDLAPSVSGLNYRMLDSHEFQERVGHVSFSGKVVFEKGLPPSLLKDKEKMRSLLALSQLSDVSCN